MRITVLIIVFTAIPTISNLYANNSKGNAIITIFSDFHSGFGFSNHDRGFGLERTYIGYKYKLSQNLEIKSVMDFGMSDDVNDNHRIGFIKNAFLKWRSKSFIISGGMISTTQFRFQETFWGKRYVMKSFQDEYGFGNSADLAVSVEYKVNPFLTFDGIIANGEGYKQVQVNDGLLYGLGMTIGEYKRFVFRTYASYNESSDAMKTDKGILYKGEVNIACFAGFKNKMISLGVEYNMMMNSNFVNSADRNISSPLVMSMIYLPMISLILFPIFSTMSMKEMLKSPKRRTMLRENASIALHVPNLLDIFFFMPLSSNLMSRKRSIFLLHRHVFSSVSMT